MYLSIIIPMYNEAPIIASTVRTLAAAMEDQVPETVKRERSAALIAEKNRVRDRILSAIVAEGEPLSVIPEVRTEDGYTAHADTFVEVRVRTPQHTKDLHGEPILVRPTGHASGVLLTELI